MKKEGGQNAFAFCHTLILHNKLQFVNYRVFIREKPRRRAGEYQRFT